MSSSDRPQARNGDSIEESDESRDDEKLLHHEVCAPTSWFNHISQPFILDSSFSDTPVEL